MNISKLNIRKRMALWIASLATVGGVMIPAATAFASWSYGYVGGYWTYCTSGNITGPGDTCSARQMRSECLYSSTIWYTRRGTAGMYTQSYNVWFSPSTGWYYSYTGNPC